MATQPSLSNAFSNLLSGFSGIFGSAPAIPKTSSYTSVGVSSPSALAAGGMSKLPASPNMSVYTPPRASTTPAQTAASIAANPHTGANASYVNPADATASKGTVPYIPAGMSGGGMSLVPTSTSAATGLPSSSVPGAISPAGSKGALPTMPNTSSTPAAPARTSSAASTSSFGSAAPSSPDLSAFSSPAAPSAGFGSSGAASGTGTSGGGFNVGGTLGGAGTQPYVWDSLNGGGTSPNSTDPYGLSYFSSEEQKKALKAYQDSLQMSPEEIAASENLKNLNSSFKSAYTNAQGQAIPMAFITGQQRQLQNQQANLAGPLEGEIALLQAKRQLAGTAAQTGVTAANDRITAYRDFMKPVPTSYGGTLSQFDPATGTYKTLVNPFGTATGTATGGSGSGTDITATIGGAIANGQITQDMVTRYGIPFIAATLKADPGYNFITQKASTAANAASLKTQQAYVDTVTRSFNAANENLSSLIQFMNTSGVNTGSTVPLINELQNKVKAGVTDAGTIAAFQSSLQGLRSEYAQVLARGGEVTDSARSSAASLIPDNITPAQLQQVASRLNIEGQNAIAAATQQVGTIKARTGSNAGSSNFGTSSGGGDPSNPFSASNFFGS